jgi:hypothetical protein
LPHPTLEGLFTAVRRCHEEEIITLFHATVTMNSRVLFHQKDIFPLGHITRVDFLWNTIPSRLADPSPNLQQLLARGCKFELLLAIIDQGRDDWFQ